MDSDKLIALIECVEDKLVEDITPRYVQFFSDWILSVHTEGEWKDFMLFALYRLLGKWPNTYTFTKAVAENVIRKQAGDLPVGIFRPAIGLQGHQSNMPLSARALARSHHTRIFQAAEFQGGAGTVPVVKRRNMRVDLDSAAVAQGLFAHQRRCALGEVKQRPGQVGFGQFRMEMRHLRHENAARQRACGKRAVINARFQLDFARRQAHLPGQRAVCVKHQRVARPAGQQPARVAARLQAQGKQAGNGLLGEQLVAVLHQGLRVRLYLPAGIPRRARPAQHGHQQRGENAFFHNALPCPGFPQKRGNISAPQRGFETIQRIVKYAFFP